MEGFLIQFTFSSMCVSAWKQNLPGDETKELPFDLSLYVLSV
jgi:hypothetical protein